MTKIGIGSDGKSGFASGLTGFHETLHLFGLEDRYNISGGNWSSSYTGYEKDVMGVYNTYPAAKLQMNQSHFNNWGNYIRSNGLKSGAIINVTVDKNPHTQELQ